MTDSPAAKLRAEARRLETQASRLLKLAAEMDGEPQEVTEREIEDDVVLRLTRAGELG